MALQILHKGDWRWSRRFISPRKTAFGLFCWKTRNPEAAVFQPKVICTKDGPHLSRI